MKESKLTQILSSFTIDEMKRFRKFVESPYYNGSENVVNFYRQVEKFHLGFSSRNYNLRYIYSKIFPEKNYHDGFIRNLASDLYKLAENFLVADSIRDTSEYDLQLLKALKEKELNDLFRANHKKSISRLNSTQKDDLFYLNLYNIQNEYWSMYNVAKKTDKKAEEFVNNQVHNAEHLINFFLSRLLKSYCSIANNSSDFKVKPVLPMFDEINEHFKRNSYDNEPAIKLYYDSLKLFLNADSEELFDKVHKSLQEYHKQLPHADVHVLYITLLNSSTTRIYKGKTEHYKKGFEIVKEILAGKYYDRGAELMEYGFFSNCVLKGLYFKEYDWVEKFIIDNRKRLWPPEQRKNAFNYYYALLEFFKKNFEKSLELLAKSNPTDFFLLLSAQRLKLMLYYEFGRVDEIYYLMDAYKHTLSRHTQVVERYKAAAKTFIDCFAELLKLKLEFDGFGFESLKKRIESEQVTFKEWFEEKLAGLDKK